MKKILLFIFATIVICQQSVFAQILGQNMIENFENTRLINYGYISGTLTQPLANPNVGPGNPSAQVGNYVRSASTQYDVIVCNLQGVVLDIADYVANNKKFTMKLYTNAPIGTPVQLTLQNGLASTAAYPTGRHSVYVTRTTLTNAWETLEFSFDNTPDPNAPASSLDQLVISFNNNTNTGDTYTWDDLAGAAIGAPSAVVTREFHWTNFTTVNNVFFRKADGTFNKVQNPARTPQNNHDSVGQYVRSANQYDVLNLKWRGQLRNLVDYKANLKKFSLKVFSPAAGTRIQFTLQDSLGALNSYPTGRYAEFTGVTTTTNQWETVVLSWVNSPDVAMPDFAVNEVAILFNSNTFLPVTVHLDSVFGPIIGAPLPSITKEFLWSNFNSIRRLTYRRSDGNFSTVANPNLIPGTFSDSVAKYTRSAVQYDVLQFRWDDTLQNLGAYRANQRKFSVKVFSPAVGTTVQFTLQDSAGARNNYPTGRFAEFTGVTTTANQWETVVLGYANTPDPNVVDTKVNELAILFNSNTTTPITVYLDSIYGPVYSRAVGLPQSILKSGFNVYPQPASHQLIIQDPNNDIEQVLISDITGREIINQTISNEIGMSNLSILVNTSILRTGVYRCAIKTNVGWKSQRIIIQK